MKNAGLAKTTDGSERCPQDSKSRDWPRRWSMDGIAKTADNQESMVQGVQRDTGKQVSEYDDTDELSDIPKVSYKCKAEPHYSNS